MRFRSTTTENKGSKCKKNEKSCKAKAN